MLVALAIISNPITVLTLVELYWTYYKHPLENHHKYDHPHHNLHLRQQQQDEDAAGGPAFDYCYDSDESYDNSEYWSSDDEVEAEVGSRPAAVWSG